jgi:hypothetical protein
MRLRNSFVSSVLLFALADVCSGGTFALVGEQIGSWPAILSAVGHVPGPAVSADVFVALPRTPAAADWQNKVRGGAALVLEGVSPLAASFGFRTGQGAVSTIHLVDVHNPSLPVIWSKSVELPRVELAGDARDARVFAKERWTGAPLVAGYRYGAGAVLWVAVQPGRNGYERFPYLMQSLADLGVEPPVRSSRLWAFFDYSYRTRADPDYLAERWRKAGIAALHVASWHFYDPAADRDEYLTRLIEACHRQGVLVYAWIELPHVSERFWQDHPAWREKTGVLQDAQLDWRKLMNLQNADCTAAIRTGLKQMAQRFDWDGVNLAELYFESLEGAANPARFTPLNNDVRAAFRAQSGWDPLEIWAAHGTPHNDAKSLRQFLDFRADLARRMQEEWLSAAEQLKPGLEIVLTHVDDRFDTGMKDSIGADASRVLPLLSSHRFSFLIEDPATVWNLGPQRYPEIATRYRPLTPFTGKLAIDINIVDRYQDVYPTKQQTGTELFELVHLASTAFQRVALYFENSILKPDLGLLAASSAVLNSYEKDRRRVTLDSPSDIELLWNEGGAMVDGKPWPLLSKTLVRLPAGKHVVEPGGHRAGIAVVDLNAKLRSASADGKRVTFEYSSDSRAIVRFDRKPVRMELDGLSFVPDCVASSNCAVLLPGGDHRVSSF